MGRRARLSGAHRVRGPGHHRATRHGPPGELHRLEHLERFVVDVAERVPPEDDLVILGPGMVRERLEREVLDGDARHGRTRTVTCEASLPMTDRQLVARLRHLVGSDPRRRTVGAYRWSEAPAHQPSGRLVGLPRRKVQKRPGQPDAAKP